MVKAKINEYEYANMSDLLFSFCLGWVKEEKIY